MHCEPKPVEFILENIHDTDATICPEELAQRKLENSNKILFNKAVNLEKENVPSQNEDQNNLGEIIPGSTDRWDEKTTICPEELQRNKLEDTLIENSQDNQHEDSDSENTEIKDEEKHKQTSEETTTICPEEIEKEKSKGVEQNLNTEENLLNISEMGNLEDNRNFETLINHDDFTLSDTTTICPEELDKKNDKIYNIIGIVEPNANLDTHKESFDSFVDEPITVCPKELARIKLEQSQKYLTKFKELVKKSQEGKTFRKRRQATDYSTYYANQPSYNAQGVAVLSDNNYLNQQQSNYNSKEYNLPSQAALGTNQNLPSHKPLGYNLQSYSPQAVKTYQQLRKPYQPPNAYQKNTNIYPKTYQNNLKSVKMYRNPSTYVRYPSNGSLTNYRVNTVGNRRQFQGARPVASTSARPNIRITRKKKFKPSPVFA